MNKKLQLKYLKTIRSSGYARTSLFQRRFHLSYPNSAKIMNWLEELGVIDPFDGDNITRELNEDKLDVEIAKLISNNSQDE